MKVLYKEVYNVFDSMNVSMNAFKKLEEQCSLILFGGGVRDFIYNQDNYEPRDLDFVLVGADQKNIMKLLKEYFDNHLRSNQFGGIKIVFDTFNIDIWRLEDTMAFKKGLLSCSVDNLLNSVFLNIDAYAYCMNSKKYINNCNLKPYPTKIETVLEEQESLNLNLLRAVVYSNKYKIPISNKIKNLLVDQLRDRAEKEKMIEMQVYHFKKEIINLEELERELQEGEI